GPVFDESLAGKLANRLAHRTATDAHFAGENVVGEPAARFGHAGKQLFADDLVSVLLEGEHRRGLCRRMLSLVVCGLPSVDRWRMYLHLKMVVKSFFRLFQKVAETTARR